MPPAPGEVLHRCLRALRTPAPLSTTELLARAESERYFTVLENPGVASEYGRYAWVCADPFWILRSKRGRCWSGPPGAVAPVDASPLDELARLMARHGAEPGPGSDPREALPPFVGGALGYLGYELLHLIEDVPEAGRDDLDLPDTYLAFFDLVFATDLLARTSWILATGFGPDAATARARADARLAEGQRWLAVGEGVQRPTIGGPLDGPSLRERAAAVRAREPRLSEAGLRARGVEATVDRPAYLEAISEIREEISAGRVFEVCLTQRFDADFDGRGRQLYEILRAINPAPMSAYLRTPEAEVLSASPERFLRLDRQGKVETRPIKGTRPRGSSEAEDLALRDDLLTAEKDRAENLMIVDLCRSDLGRVCRFGSVRVDELCGVHPFEFTWQMISTIRGQLREDCGVVDLLRATFPGGSMTGAPKVEAMKVIAGLEPTARGVFSGAIGFFDFDGGLDLSIVIRTIIKTGARLSFHVGGAIVADSDPAEEYQETLDKAHALVLAIELARERDPAEESTP
ncbi:aminodeoxychorismate synthase component I [Pseudenhygromyxa sp. WMMC2535]|uniref:aminodeoxychorismate synthase component I n=1 Tax=Pseudenhygromyxa sp. WMMC2535 TaxID=2712867 RepID=UPI0015546C16|nr:aminodeoxychorismate synthase component I [Pseudenhygromyxa sp. WMMC2535]NVB39191.1 aminodeoxychorismate synthase component I [Pseudenhygromyxa sp. WMMC2535]